MQEDLDALKRALIGAGIAPRVAHRCRQPLKAGGFFSGQAGPRSFEMEVKLYVGNLGYAVTDSDLAQLFAPHGTVESAQIIMDRDTGRSKGFGFVEMNSDAEAAAAINGLNMKEIDGRSLTVNEARPREPRRDVRRDR